MDEIKEHNDPVSYKISSHQLLAEQGIRTILTNIAELDSQFYIPVRTEEIQSFPCSNCHTQDLVSLKGKETPKSHWQIEIHHASVESMQCATCHDLNKPNQLTSLTGAKIDFNESYKLCSQCHSNQYKDWKGGAHGKSLSGWVPPRVSQTCTGCHNPHKPGFEKRWPSRLNTVRMQQLEGE